MQCQSAVVEPRLLLGHGSGCRPSLPSCLLMTSAAQAPLLERMAPALVPELKIYIERHREAVIRLIEPGGDQAGMVASRQYARVFDGLLSSLFHAARGAMGSRWKPVTLAAVGSYGRGALALHSDLDVRLCTFHKERATPIAEALLYPLWDTGLSVGHQVVSPDDTVELARTDMPTATSLLDWRHVAGEEGEAEGQLARVFEGVFGPGNLRQFLTQLAEGAQSRESRFGDSVYLLEPEVKSGAGGLRDLDIAHWAARARWRIQDLAELVRLGVLSQREWQPIEAAREFQWRVRNLLHLISTRRSDRLSFDAQEQLAERFDYGTGGPGVERFMSEYYRHARVIWRTRDMVLSRAMPPPQRKPRETRLGDGLKLHNRKVSIEHPGYLEAEPALALRVYDEAVRRELPVYDFARDAISRVALNPEWCERLRADEEAAKLFVRLVKTVKRTSLRRRSVLKELHDVGLLVAMVPEFAPVVGRVHHDIYHVYTVDVHSVAAVDRLRWLLRGDLTEEHPLASRLAAEAPRKNVLFFATLLHDVGKDIGGRNHSQRGAEMADAILQRLHLPKSDISEVQHLISKHLRMYHVATRRDLDDPRTMEEFANEVHGQEGLRELFLLTISDVSTTSPTAMTSWKARMLDELYLATSRYLEEGGHNPERGTDEARRQVEKLCEGRVSKAVVDSYLAALPERYAYANEPEWIAKHLELTVAAQGELAKVQVMSEDDPYVEVAVVAEDRHGLLSLIAASFAASRVKIIGAQVYSFRDPDGAHRALDLFWVRGGTSVRTAHSVLPRVERDLQQLLQGEVSAEEIVSRVAKPSWAQRTVPTVETRVSIDNRAASDSTVVEVVTRDRPNLLFHLARVITASGFTIELAKINTEGARVADVFYVTDEGGTKVTEFPRIEELKTRITASIAELEREDEP